MAPASAARLVTRRPPSRPVRLRSNERLPCLRCISRCIEEPLFRGTLCSTDNPSTRRPCRVFPRRKAGEASRASSEPIVVTRKMIAAFFDRPLRQASIDLGISQTALKSACRKLEVPLPPARLSSTPHVHAGGWRRVCTWQEARVWDFESAIMLTHVTSTPARDCRFSGGPSSERAGSLPVQARICASAMTRSTCR